MGRRRRARRRVVAGVGVGVLATVTAPFLFLAQGEDPAAVDHATSPAVLEDRLADPVGRVVTDLNKLYLPGATSVSAGAMSVWGEDHGGEVPSLHYGWTSEDGAVHHAGVLHEPDALAHGLQVRVVPSPGADAEEPTFVVTHPILPGTRAATYAVSVESYGSDVRIDKHVDVVPGFVVFTFSPVQVGGGVPDVHFVGLTGPDGLEVGVDLDHGDGGWSTTPADAGTR